MPTFYDLLASTEGGGSFDTLFGHSQREGGQFAGVRPSEMTLAELQAFEDNEYGPWSKEKLGYKATPVGLSQIVGQTRRGLAKDMGLSDDTLFDEKTQRAMTRRLIDQSGGDLDRLRGTWEGFKHVSDEDLQAAWDAYQGSGSIGMGGQVPATMASDGSISRGPQQAVSRRSPRPQEKPEEPEYADNWLGRAEQKRDDMRAGLGDKLGMDTKQMEGIGGGLQGLGNYLMRGGFG